MRRAVAIPRGGGSSLGRSAIHRDSGKYPDDDRTHIAANEANGAKRFWRHSRHSRRLSAPVADCPQLPNTAAAKHPAIGIRVGELVIHIAQSSIHVKQATAIAGQVIRELRQMIAVNV